jgi:diguanylate cyclase
MGPFRRAVPLNQGGGAGWRRRDERHVDEEGELLSVPLPLSFLWLVLAVLTVLEAVSDLFNVAGPHWLYDNWVHNAILAVCAALVLGRAAFESVARRAWMAFGMALLLWFIGSAAWSVAYSGQPDAPYPSFADVFWLAWYPLVAVGIYYLIRVRIPQFELHRWMDGIAVTLLVLAAGFALVVQPVADHEKVGRLATVVAFAYPVLDVLLIGAVLGVYGLLGWRPDTMWILIGLAVVSMSVADAVFAVQEAEGRAIVSGDRFDFVWTAGAVLIALAAWARAPDADANPEAVTGMRAVALALFAEALAIGIQIYAVFREIGRSERIVTVVVLVVASVQIILTRPRRTNDDSSRLAEAAQMVPLENRPET